MEQLAEVLLAAFFAARVASSSGVARAGSGRAPLTVRSMRAVVLSRKNSLFAGSNEGAGKLGFPLPRL
jgi:hypothetical protein